MLLVDGQIIGGQYDGLYLCSMSDAWLKDHAFIPEVRQEMEYRSHARELGRMEREAE